MTTATRKPTTRKPTIAPAARREITALITDRLELIRPASTPGFRVSQYRKCLAHAEEMGDRGLVREFRGLIAKWGG